MNEIITNVRKGCPKCKGSGNEIAPNLSATIGSHLDCENTVETYKQSIKETILAVAECLGGHMIGLNCRGPVLDDSTAKNWKLLVESMKETDSPVKSEEIL